MLVYLQKVVTWLHLHHKKLALCIGGVAGVVCPLIGTGSGPCAVVGEALTALLNGMGA